MRSVRACLAILLMSAMPLTASAQETLSQPNKNGEFLPDPTQETPLDEQELLAAFSGKTHRGTYNFKRRNIETFAFMETTSADGTTAHYHGDKIDTGTWRVKRNVICFVYDNWDGGVHRACFNVYKRGNCFYHYGLSSGPNGLGGAFTARSVHADETPDCEPSMV